MKYILNPDIALRSFWYVPYAYYVRNDFHAKKLQKEEYLFLSKCDGIQDLEENELSGELEKRGFISKAKEGERMSDWQKARFCNNRYFPLINWMITGKCNFNCRHCFNAADNARLQSEFTLEEAEKLLDDAELCGITGFTITGGEPMLHPHFMDIVRSIYKRNMYIQELNTNGHFITQDILDEMKEIGCYPLMKISFDGIGCHDWMRGREGAEEDALRAIKLCKDNGFRVMVQTNVHRHNVESMLPTAKLLDGMGVDVMRIIRTTEAPRWLQNAPDGSLGIEEYYDRMNEFCTQYIKTDCKMEIIVWQYVNLYPASKHYWPVPITYSEGEYRDSLPVCKGNRGMVAVAANGHVFPCHQMSGYYEQHGFILGNVKETGLQPLLQEGRYLSQVTCTVKDLREHNQKCADCEWFKYCCGGCRAIGQLVTEDIYGSDIFKCIFFKKGYLEKLADALPGYHSIAHIHKGGEECHCEECGH